MAKVNPCKICRRSGKKLFLKGEKCFSPNCPLNKKPYPPGQRNKKRRRSRSEMGKELLEKQKMKNIYNLSEKQFKKYVNEVLRKRNRVEDAGLELIKKLESRLDNVIFRLGISFSRNQAKQLVSHSHFLVNGKPVNIASYQLKKGDIISLKEQKKKKQYYKEFSLKKNIPEPPSWLKFDRQKMEGKVIGIPSADDLQLPVEIHSIFEFYSK